MPGAAGDFLGSVDQTLIEEGRERLIVSESGQKVAAGIIKGGTPVEVETFRAWLDEKIPRGNRVGR